MSRSMFSSRPHPIFVMRLVLVGILMLGVGLVSCTGEQGDRGPAGPEGDPGPPGPDCEPCEPGPPGLVWLGDWDPSTDYAATDAVQHSGSAYVCILQHINQRPPNSSFWDVLASGGEWNGGQVLNPTTFNAQVTFTGGTDFQPGTAVDFSGAAVTGLAATWNGGVVDNECTFNGGASFTSGQIEFSGSSILFPGSGEPTVQIWGTDLGYESASVELDGRPSNSEAKMWADVEGDARIRLSSNSVHGAVELYATENVGGCGRLKLLDNSGDLSIYLNGCTGEITSHGTLSMRNSQGQVTIELDPETGNIYYTGSLMKK